MYDLMRDINLPSGCEGGTASYHNLKAKPHGPHPYAYLLKGRIHLRGKSGGAGGRGRKGHRVRYQRSLRDVGHRG